MLALDLKTMKEVVRTDLLCHKLDQARGHRAAHRQVQHCAGLPVVVDVPSMAGSWYCALVMFRLGC